MTLQGPKLATARVIIHYYDLDHGLCTAHVYMPQSQLVASGHSHNLLQYGEQGANHPWGQISASCLWSYGTISTAD